MNLYVQAQLSRDLSNSGMMSHLSRHFHVHDLERVEDLSVGPHLALVAPLSPEQVPHLGLVLPQLVVLSSKGVDDRAAQHFDWGCADFLLSPIEPSYLKAKLESLSRRWSRDLLSLQVDRIDETLDVHLTTKEKLLLGAFLELGDRGAKRDLLTKLCWGQTEVHGKTLDTHLFNLRKKLDRAGFAILYRGGAWYLQGIGSR